MGSDGVRMYSPLESLCPKNQILRRILGICRYSAIRIRAGMSSLWAGWEVHKRELCRMGYTIHKLRMSIRAE